MRVKGLLIVFILLSVLKVSARDYAYVEELLAAKKFKKAYSYVSDPDKMGQAGLSPSAMLFCKAKVYDEVYRSGTAIQHISRRHIATAAMRMYNKIIEDVVHETYQDASRKRKRILINHYKEEIKSRLHGMSPVEVASLMEELVEIEPEGYVLVFAGKCADFSGDHKSAGYYYIKSVDKEKQDLSIYNRIFDLNHGGFINDTQYMEFMNKAIIDHNDCDRIMKEKLTYMKQSGVDSFEEYEFIYKKIIETDSENIRPIEMLVILYVQESDKNQYEGKNEEAKKLLENAKEYLDFGNRFEAISSADKIELDRLSREVEARYLVVSK